MLFRVELLFSCTYCELVPAIVHKVNAAAVLDCCT